MGRIAVFRFSAPLFLLLLPLIPAYLYYEIMRKQQQHPSLPLSRLHLLTRISGRQRWWQYLYPGIRALILLFLILALAHPQWGSAQRDFSKKGVDIVISMDVSGSMLALDFLPQNRLGAAVKVAKDFVSGRPNDRFALVAFSEYAITSTPLTYDHAAVMHALDNLEVNMEASGTAVGMGLAKALARLKDSSAESRIVILITDGVNNSGEIDPISAARMAQEMGVKVYPIGVGSGGMVPFPYADPFFGTRNIPTLIELDMETLDEIASITGTGMAAKAMDANQLRNIMNELDEMERTEYSSNIRYHWEDRFSFFLWLALILLVVEIFFRSYLMPLLPE